MLTHIQPLEEGSRPTGAARPGVTQELSYWVAGLTFDALPSEVVAHIKLCIIDSLGCGFYGAAQPWGGIAGNVAALLSPGGSCSLLGRPEKAGPADAAMANGTAIHGFEIDDVHTASSFHPGCVTVPAALAIAEACIASGKAVSGRDLLVAVVAGYETGFRVGMCAGVSHSTSGFHVTGTVGAVAAAATSARILDLSPDRSTHALAIGTTQAAGLYAARKGAMAKRFHAGRASQSGVISAYLASEGFTGSTEALEADFGGFMSTLHGQSDPATILDELGSRWEVLRVGFKAYASCASAHTSVDAIDRLMAQGLSIDNLERLTIRTSKKTKLNIGWPYVPNGIAAAQMNGYYTAAVKLLDGDAFIDQYREERLADPAILSIVPRIEIVHEPDLDLGGAAKRHAIRAEAVLTDGRVLHASVDQRKGSPEYPLSQADIAAKFHRLAAGALPEIKIDALADCIMHLENVTDIVKLTKLIAV